jgi:hypothetical protein
MTKAEPGSFTKDTRMIQAYPIRYDSRLRREEI